MQQRSALGARLVAARIPGQLFLWRHHAVHTNDSEVMKVTGHHSCSLLDENVNLIAYGTRKTPTVDCSLTEG